MLWMHEMSEARTFGTIPNTRDVQVEWVSLHKRATTTTTKNADRFRWVINDCKNQERHEKRQIKKKQTKLKFKFDFYARNAVTGETQPNLDYFCFCCCCFIRFVYWTISDILSSNRSDLYLLFFAELDANPSQIISSLGLNAMYLSNRNWLSFVCRHSSAALIQQKTENK